jgi:hypothetical protein
MRRLTLLTQLVSLVFMCVFACTFFTSTSLSLPHPLESWLYVINLHNNSYVSFRRDHLTQLLNLLTSIDTLAERPLALLIPLLVGIFSYLNLARKNTVFQRLIMSLIPVVLVLYTSGIDPIILGTLAWAPLCALLLYRFIHSAPHWKTTCALAVTSFELAYTANSTAFLAVLVCLALLTIAEHATDRRASTSSRRNWAFLTLLLPSVWMLVTLPAPPFFDLPKTAHVLHSDPSNDNIYLPIIGRAPLFPIIDYQNLYPQITPISSLLLGLSGLLLLSSGIEKRALWRSVLLGAIVILTILWGTPLIPEQFTAITPLLSLSRIIPWASFYALPAVLLGIVSLFLGLALSIQCRSVIASSLTLGFGIAATLINPNNIAPLLYQSIVEKSASLAPALQSPSAALIRRFKADPPLLLSYLQHTEKILAQQPLNAAKLGATISIHPAPTTEALQTSRRTDPEGRWSPRTGRQTGRELLTIALPRPMTITAVELDPGHYFSDYPRGLDISGGDCSSKSITHITTITKWHGPLRITPMGLPFYDVPHNVTIVFPEEHIITCLYIRQTGKAPVDWSINKIKLYQ